MTEGERQLGDPNIYSLLETNPTTEFRGQFISLLYEFVSKCVTTDQMAEISFPYDFSAASFYLLEKVHKQGVHDRPVIRGCVSLTQKTSEMLD